MFNRSIRIKVVFVFMIYFLMSPSVDLAEPPGQLAKGISIKAVYATDGLHFSVINGGSNDAFVADNFCFEPHMNAVVVNLNDFGHIVGAYSSGISRLSGRMVLLKAHGGRYDCAITYFPGTTKFKSDESPFIVWDTILFVGRNDNSYDNIEFSGFIHITLPIGKMTSPVHKVDEISLYSFQHRRDMGIIKPLR